MRISLLNEDGGWGGDMAYMDIGWEGARSAFSQAPPQTRTWEWLRVCHCLTEGQVEYVD